MIIYRFIYCIQLEGMSGRPPVGSSRCRIIRVPSTVHTRTGCHKARALDSVRHSLCEDYDLFRFGFQLHSYPEESRWPSTTHRAGVWAASTDRCVTDPRITCHYCTIISSHVYKPHHRQAVLHCSSSIYDTLMLDKLILFICHLLIHCRSL